jgi:hypothetical protein
MFYISELPEGFVSKRASEIYGAAVSLFSNPDTTFTDFKKKANVDFVEYDSVKTLYKDGKLTPDNVDTVI